MVVALFLLGALVFLRFVIFAPSAVGSSKTSFFPVKKAWLSRGAALLKGNVPVAFADHGENSASNPADLALLSAGANISKTPFSF